MVAHLFWQDVKHNLRPIRALPLLALAIFLAYRTVEYHEDITDTQAELFFAEGALSLNHYWLLPTNALVAGVMGASLAAERRTGVTLNILAKGVQRRDYILAKLLGAAASGALVTFAAILGFFAIIFATWIPGRALDFPPGWPVGPVKSLFAYSPFAHDLLVASMEIAAAAGLSVMGVLAGLIVANEYVAMVATPIALIIWTVVAREVARQLSPERYIAMDYAFYWGPHFRWLIPFAPFLYWGVFALIISTICQRIFAKKEIA